MASCFFYYIWSLLHFRGVCDCFDIKLLSCIVLLCSSLNSICECSGGHASVRWVSWWWAMGLGVLVRGGQQHVSRLIPVGVHPCSQGNCCGPSGRGFNHNSPHLHSHTYALAHTTTVTQSRQSIPRKVLWTAAYHQTFLFLLFILVISVVTYISTQTNPFFFRHWIIYLKKKHKERKKRNANNDV